nr:DUF2487 family protein [Thalassobacillus pellis]
MGAKEYIDTLIVPLIPFDPSVEHGLKEQAFQSELLGLFMREIDKEFKGRVLLSPEYYYIEDNREQEIPRINSWCEKFQQQPFEHLFLFTFDVKWKRLDKDLTGELIWLPGRKNGSLQSSETISFVKEQTSQITEMIRSYW